MPELNGAVVASNGAKPTGRGVPVCAYRSGVGVGVTVGEGVMVAVNVGVMVGVLVDVAVAVNVGVKVGVAVGKRTDGEKRHINKESWMIERASR